MINNLTTTMITTEEMRNKDISTDDIIRVLSSKGIYNSTGSNGDTLAKEMMYARASHIVKCITKTFVMSDMYDMSGTKEAKKENYCNIWAIAWKSVIFEIRKESTK